VSELAWVCDPEEWEGRLEMREALDDIARRYHLGKYEQPPTGRRVVRRKPQLAEVVVLAEWKARREQLAQAARQRRLAPSGRPIRAGRGSSDAQAVTAPYSGVQGRLATIGDDQ
jgi:hypothetical protein